MRLYKNYDKAKMHSRRLLITTDGIIRIVEYDMYELKASKHKYFLSIKASSGCLILIR